MRTLSSWATRLALSAGATAGIVAACYNEVPGPSGPLPLPPTREAPPMGPRPGPITPTPITPAPTPITPTPAPSPPMPPLDAGPASTSRETESRVIEMNARFAGAQEADQDDEDIEGDEDEDDDGAEDDGGEGGTEDDEDGGSEDDAFDAGVDGGADAGDDGLEPIDAAVTDAGVADVIDLPPLPDSDVPIEPPGLPH